MHLRRILFLLVVLAGLAGLPGTTGAAAPGQHVQMHVFWSVDCPHCVSQKPFLRELEQRYPRLVIHEREISRTRLHHDLFRSMAASHGIESGSVPTIFVGGQAWIGDGAQIRREIESTVARESAAASLAGEPTRADTPLIDSPLAVSPDIAPPGRFVVPLFGTIDTGAHSIVVATVLIALVDGLNPCSLWVLMLLLGLVLHSGSRGRVALVGITFLTTTTVVYGAFVAGVFSVLSFVLYLTWVQWLVAAIALTVGAINIKDYFWFGRGLSFTIPEHHKPGIYRGIRTLTDPKLTGFGLVGATVVMAAGIALVELPCTAGFPVVWSGIVAEHNIAGGAFLLLLGLYLLIYLADELLVFGVAVLTLRMGRFEERHGRNLKLIGGTIMVALGLVLLIDPDLMNNLGSTLAIFVAAIVLAVLIAMVHRRWGARG